MTPFQVLEALEALGAKHNERLVISGGEPLLQQDNLVQFVEWIYRRDWKIEIETNGTQVPSYSFDRWVYQYNCSPKLSNSGDPKELRVKEEVLRRLVANDKVNFKFVVGAKEDIGEILEYVRKFEITPFRVYLMPLGKTQLELDKTREATKSLCDEFRFNFSDRLHITQLGGGRGV